MYARYTEILRDLMKNEQTAKLLDNALSTYPLYEGKKEYDLIPTRAELNRKLLNHYKYREIGFETVGRFLDELQITMEEIMPYYNERLKTIEIMADLDNPFDNVDFTETYEEIRTDSSEGSGTGTSKNSNTGKDTSSTTSNAKSDSSSTSETNQTDNGKQVRSDTPQDSLSISSKNINSVNYASEATWDENIASINATQTGSDTSEAYSEGTADHTSSGETETTSQTSSQSSGTTRHTFNKKGNQGVNTYAHDMNEFRTALIDVVDEIINDSRINELFMLVY